MTSRAHWKFLVFAVLLSGCQSVNDVLPGRMSGQPRYTADELASLSDPQPAAARPSTAQSVQQVSSSSTVATADTPIAAGRVDQLIKSGQTAIREAGQGNPARLQEARQIFEQVLAMDAANASAHHGTAIVADLQHDWPTAEHHYKLALQQRPQDASLLNDLGYSYLLQNRFYEASQYLTEAIRLSPQHERAHINIALLSLKRGDRHGAETQLAAIYSPTEINATLARLEQDLQQTAMNSAPVAGTTQPPFGGPRPVGTDPLQQQTAATGFQPQQPVHVYPPGVMPEASPQAPRHTAMLPSGSPDHLGQRPGFNGGAVTPATYPGLNPSVNMATHHGYPTPVGGVIATPPAGSQQYQHGAFQPATATTQYPPQHPPQYSAGTPQGRIPQMHPAAADANGYPVAQPLMRTGVPGVDPRAPIAGLNAGPGTLFPIGVGGPGAAGHFAPNSQVPPATYNYPGPQGQVPAQPTQPQYPNGVMHTPSQTRPISVLPGEEYRQHGLRPLNTPQQQQRSTATVSATQYGTPRSMPPLNAANTYPGRQVPSASGMQQQYGQYPPAVGGVPAPGASPSPLTAYEQQLRLNNQYNQTIQQMNGRGTAMNPAPVQ